MTNDFNFREEALVDGVYLQIKDILVSNSSKHSYSLRAFNNLRTFPVNSYAYWGEDNDSTSMYDLISLLEAQAAPYRVFHRHLAALQPVIHSPDYSGYGRDLVLKNISSPAKELFFREQLPRLSVVGRELWWYSEHLRREGKNHSLHYDHSDFYKMYQAVLGLHRAVQTAESSFDVLAVGTTVLPGEKYGEQPKVRSQLDLAEGYLKILCKDPPAAETMRGAQKINLESKVEEAKVRAISVANKLSGLLK